MDRKHTAHIGISMLHGILIINPMVAGKDLNKLPDLVRRTIELYSQKDKRLSKHFRTEAAIADILGQIARSTPETLKAATEAANLAYRTLNMQGLSEKKRLEIGRDWILTIFNDPDILHSDFDTVKDDIIERYYSVFLVNNSVYRSDLTMSLSLTTNKIRKELPYVPEDIYETLITFMRDNGIPCI